MGEVCCERLSEKVWAKSCVATRSTRSSANQLSLGHKAPGHAPLTWHASHLHLHLHQGISPPGTGEGDCYVD